MGNAGPFPARWPRTRRSAEMVANQISLDKSACVRGIHGSSASAISPGERRSLKSGDVRPVAGHLGESAAGLKPDPYGLRQASSGLAKRAWRTVTLKTCPCRERARQRPAHIQP